MEPMRYCTLWSLLIHAPGLFLHHLQVCLLPEPEFFLQHPHPVLISEDLEETQMGQLESLASFQSARGLVGRQK